MQEESVIMNDKTQINANYRRKFNELLINLSI